MNPENKTPPKQLYIVEINVMTGLSVKMVAKPVIYIKTGWLLQDNFAYRK